MRREDGQRAAVYCRVGSARQAEYGRSLEVQRARVEAALRGSGAVATMVFVDIGVSGSVPIASRPQGQRLCQAVRSGDVDLVAAEELDRLFCDTLDCLITEREWRGHGCRLYVLDLDVDTESPVGEAFLSIYVAILQYQRQVAGERTRVVLDARRADGIYSSSSVPYGYQRERRVLAGRPESFYVSHPDHAPVLRRIYELAIAGHSPKSIAELLSADQIPAPSGQATWSPRTVRTLLHGPVYCGLVGSARAVAGGADPRRMPPAVNVEPLVTTADWSAAQAACGRVRDSR